ncbi:MAG: hypothetical protein AUK47_05635 [Deltaproteobacteria bacterium CG2_30_63_29]|nr:MAG: hypothetical protein AUK47_05635 [Deltaproteobacteria bacterium CG2_30_63_29]PJB39478.1 MAG: peroxidase [Deltaproteobacteria bacterium CG_4_9_14_3_um_filter_63_12]
MAWIDTIEPENADGELAQFYQAIGAARGGVAEVHRAQSLNPRALRAHLELYKAVVFARSSLSRIARERLAVVVSAANRCPYCVAHHSEALRQLGDLPVIIDAIAQAQWPHELPHDEELLLRWAATAAREPAHCQEADIVALRQAGYDDRAILDASLTIAYFSFVNRLVLVLGIELEDDYRKTCTEPSDSHDPEPK